MSKETAHSHQPLLDRPDRKLLLVGRGGGLVHGCDSSLDVAGKIGDYRRLAGVRVRAEDGDRAGLGE